jgi:hypothetical protein
LSVAVDDVRRARPGQAGDRKRGFVKYCDAFKS